MDSATRLQLTARITYYIGWIAALLGAVAHLGLGTGMFHSMGLVNRNLYEASMMFFIISLASAARALASEKGK